MQSGGLMTIDGNGTTIHHNCTNADSDDYGLDAYGSSSSIHLASSLTIETMKRSILTVTCTGLLAATYIYPKETKEIGLKVMKECQQQCNQVYKWCIQQMER